VWTSICTFFEKLINGIVDGVNTLVDKVNELAKVEVAGATLFQIIEIDRLEEVDVDGDGTAARFKTGGLADFTGPAWLDGTPSKPEIVLNQRDSQNFIALRDILSDSMRNGNFTTVGGNSEQSASYYDININVDSIANDYDVEQMADKIKSMIYEDSMYRNVNTIKQMR
jgi:hypothetical protein